MTDYLERLPEDGAAYHCCRRTSEGFCGKLADDGLTLTAFAVLRPYGFSMRAVCPFHANEAGGLSFSNSNRSRHMCEINPKHSAFFRLEVYTSNPATTAEEFLTEVMTRLLQMERQLNADGKFRFHIHEEAQEHAQE